jgi:hypothetical protein
MKNGLPRACLLPHQRQLQNLLSIELMLAAENGCPRSLKIPLR